MPLATGSRLGPYEIVALVGAGGMGEVYKARDTRLDRTVAIKVLPAHVAADRESRERLEREARAISSLNHPNICTLHVGHDPSTLRQAQGRPERSRGATGSGQAIDYLVMEHVAGDTLADRIKQGPLAVGETLVIARQIAEALDAAHERGMVHRDLKPANIKITPDGVEKVLDFGLVKAGAGGWAADMANSPTLSARATEAGVILGTAAYMSPEQARGLAVDKRADIWAFGCVCYEALTGRQAFPGDSVTDTLAAIVRSEPDWGALPDDTPAALRRTLVRCLRKNLKERAHDIADVRLDLEEALNPVDAASARAAPVRTAGWRTVVIVGLVAALAAVAAFAAGARRSRPQGELPSRWIGEVLGGSTVALGPGIARRQDRGLPGHGGQPDAGRGHAAGIRQPAGADQGPKPQQRGRNLLVAGRHPDLLRPALRRSARRLQRARVRRRRAAGPRRRQRPAGVAGREPAGHASQCRPQASAPPVPGRKLESWRRSARCWARQFFWPPCACFQTAARRCSTARRPRCRRRGISSTASISDPEQHDGWRPQPRSHGRAGRFRWPSPPMAVRSSWICQPGTCIGL
jgi:hypothetical protein